MFMMLAAGMQFLYKMLQYINMHYIRRCGHEGLIDERINIGCYKSNMLQNMNRYFAENNLCFYNLPNKNTTEGILYCNSIDL